MYRLVTLCLLSLTLTRAGLAVPTNDGIYAEMHTTLGTIELELYFEEAPRTVANFMSLADGTRSYVNFARGGVSSNTFYDGIIFHRVITNFMIQAGSPNQEGNDGPGYTFDDEFHSTLSNTVGALSMANSGLDSNGSQFFITVVPAPWLDNVHSVFGGTVAGMDIVSNINSVATDGDDRPLVDVSITNITFTRNGILANAFSTTNVSPRLPHVRSIQSSFGWDGTNYLMSWSQLGGAKYWVLGNDTMLNPTNWYSVTPSSGAAPGVLLDPIVNATNRFFFTAIEIEE